MQKSIIRESTRIIVMAVCLALIAIFVMTKPQVSRAAVGEQTAQVDQSSEQSEQPEQSEEFSQESSVQFEQSEQFAQPEQSSEQFEQDPQKSCEEILDSLRETRLGLEEDDPMIADLDVMIVVFEKILSDDISLIKTITDGDIEILKKYFLPEVVETIETAIKLSGTDAGAGGENENIDISDFPYSPETGELQFSEISWANLGWVIGRVHVTWENPDESTGEAIASSWSPLNRMKRINLRNVLDKDGNHLQEGARFRFFAETKVGYDTYPSKIYSYSSASDWAIGCYTDGLAWTKRNFPVAVVYGTSDYAYSEVRAMALKNAINISRVAMSAIVMLGIGAISGIITSSLHLASASALRQGGVMMTSLIFSAASGAIVGTLFLATDIILTATTSEIAVNDVKLPDIPNNDKPHNDVPNNDVSNNGLHQISGFLYVSGGYYWSKPTVHWRNPREPENTDHQAYVNEQGKKGLRLGKAAGIDLAILSRSVITDKNDSNIMLKEGDIIWFGAEVAAGRDRIAKERFIYSSTGDKAGYFTQGTTLRESGYGDNPPAHLVAFGGIDKVDMEMARYVKTAQGAYKTLIAKVAIGTANILISAVVNAVIAKIKIGQVDRSRRIAPAPADDDVLKFLEVNNNGVTIIKGWTWEKRVSVPYEQR